MLMRLILCTENMCAQCIETCYNVQKLCTSSFAGTGPHMGTAVRCPQTFGQSVHCHSILSKKYDETFGLDPVFTAFITSKATNYSSQKYKQILAACITLLN